MPPTRTFSSRSIPFGVTILRALAMIAVASARESGFGADASPVKPGTVSNVSTAVKLNIDFVLNVMVIPPLMVSEQNGLRSWCTTPP